MKTNLLKKILTSSCALGLLVATNVSYADNASKKETHIATQDIIWKKSPFGPEVWSVDGGGKGSHITYIKFNAGDITPLHTHTSDYVGIVVTGTTRHYIPGEKKTYKILPPGSHWSMSANIEHVSECLPGVECVMAVYQKKPFDFIAKGDAPKID